MGLGICEKRCKVHKICHHGQFVGFSKMGLGICEKRCIKFVITKEKHFNFISSVIVYS